jgi:UDP-glucose:(heptosyl)LPS alpha-1,3-glucosyltransferase
VSEASRARAPRGPRIALVRGRYDAFGGAERFVQNAVNALRDEGASLTLVTRSWPDQEGSAIVVDPFYIGSLWRDRGFARAACQALSKRHFDLVQSHERIACCDVYRAGDGVHAEWLAQRARIQSPLARLATRLSPHHRYLLAAERELFASARLKAVICNSWMVKNEIARRFATPPAKLVLIRNGVDGARFHPRLRGELGTGVRQQLSIPNDAMVFVHVGSGFARKGVDAMLEALALRRGKAWAIVVGKDKHGAASLAHARRLGIGDRVRFVGAVSDVRPYYAAADAFVLATLYDPFPNALLEAMACGLPVVTSPKCGGAEILTEGESGFVRDALDTRGIADAFDRVDRPTARRMGEAARAAVASLTPEAMASDYLALYHRLLEKRSIGV